MKHVKSKKTPNKLPQIFRLRADLVKSLKCFSEKSNINKTRIVELALAQFFAMKR